jgi:hypothetical protein
MRFHSTALAAAALAVSALFSARALAADASDDAHRSMGNLRLDSRTAGQAIQGSPPLGSTTRRTVVVPGVVYPYPGYSPYYSGYGYYPPNYGYYPYYGPQYRYYPRGYVYPPVFLPAERFYGPQAPRHFMHGRP